MADTYTSLHLHVVFSTKNREPWIRPEIEDQVWSYLGGICRTHGVKPLHLGGVDDHVHLLIGFPPTSALSDWLKRLKGESSKWISDHLPHLRGFAWQDGYAAFSVGQSQVDDTVRYITRQREHHRKITFAEEYRKFVEKHGLVLDDRYLLG
jgi:putative transposase